MMNSASPDTVQEQQSEESTVKRRKLDYHETIEVRVGASGQPFTLHKSTACSKSPFFEAACSLKWPEGQEGFIRLPNVEPEVFQVFVHWMYTEKLDWDHLSKGYKTRYHSPKYFTVGRAWALGEYLGSVAFRNAIIDSTIKRVNAEQAHASVSAPSLQHIWNETPAGSTFQRLIVDIMLITARERDCEASGDSWPKEIVMAAAKEYFGSRVKSKVLPQYEDRCKYHEHDEGEPKCVG